MGIRFRNISSIEIIGDGAIATNSIGVGQFIPCLILDTKDADDVSKIIMVDTSNGTIDSKIQWCRPFFKKNIIYLRIMYQEPIEVDFYIKFDIIKHYFLIETIITNKAVILYNGKVGEKISEKINSKEDNILVEVPNTGYQKTWRKMLNKMLRRKYKSEGLTYGKAKEMACIVIEKIEKFKYIRVK